MSRRRTSTRPEDARVIWISGAFGYSGDLLYFEDIFNGFTGAFPHGTIPVASDFPVEKYPNLPLLPMMRFVRLGTIRRKVGGVEYRSIRRLLSPSSLIRLAALRPDVVLVTEFGYVALAAFLSAKLTGACTVVLVESDPSYRGAPASRVARAVKAAVARAADVVLVSNRIGASYLTATLAVDPRKVRIGPYLSSDPSHGQAPTSPPGHGPVRLLFLNSVVRRKGIEELLRALAATDPRLRPGWILDVVGSGDHEAAVRRLAEELGLLDNLAFHGRKGYRDAGAMYAECDVVVAPTLADYRSLSGFEAVNAGRPLLVSGYDGASVELAERAPAVTVVDPRDSSAFAAALEPFLSRSDFLAHQQELALQVPAEFRIDQVVANVAEAVAVALTDRRA